MIFVLSLEWKRSSTTATLYKDLNNQSLVSITNCDVLHRRKDLIKMKLWCSRAAVCVDALEKRTKAILRKKRTFCTRFEWVRWKWNIHKGVWGALQFIQWHAEWCIIVHSMARWSLYKMATLLADCQTHQNVHKLYSFEMVKLFISKVELVIQEFNCWYLWYLQIIADISKSRINVSSTFHTRIFLEWILHYIYILLESFLRSVSLNE